MNIILNFQLIVHFYNTFPIGNDIYAADGYRVACACVVDVLQQADGFAILHRRERRDDIGIRGRCIVRVDDFADKGYKFFQP